MQASQDEYWSLENKEKMFIFVIGSKADAYGNRFELDEIVVPSFR